MSSSKQACVDQASDLLPSHGVVFVHGEVLKEYLEYFNKKGIGVRVEGLKKAFKLTWSRKIQGIKFAKSALVRMQGKWVYPYSYLQMAKQLITHKYVEGVGQFFIYEGRPAKDFHIPYERDELYETDTFNLQGTS
ncbi:MAG: hypothetical protein QXK74_08085 [Candidatus Nitrosocaldaceae archaeon]